MAVGGATIYLTLGVLLGALAARWRGTAADRLLVGSTLIVSSIPYYVVALLAWIYLSLQLKIFPKTGYYPITENPAKTISWMMLPWLVIGLTNCTSYARFTRGQMVETLSEDYIRTAQAKGVRTNKVLFKHALRAAIVPGDHDLRPRLRHAAGRHDLHRADLQHRRHRPLGPAGPVDADRHQRHQRRPCWWPRS